MYDDVYLLVYQEVNKYVNNMKLNNKLAIAIYVYVGIYVVGGTYIYF